MLERDLSDHFRTGWRSLAIGVAVLAASIALSQAVRTALRDSGLARLVAEGIMIFGWVANWRPAEILLYDVWTARRRLDLYRRLADAQVELRPSSVRKWRVPERTCSHWALTEGPACHVPSSAAWPRTC
jgi:hypothetical protein